MANMPDFTPESSPQRMGIRIGPLERIKRASFESEKHFFNSVDIKGSPQITALEMKTASLNQSFTLDCEEECLTPSQK
eukprot:CAMPEP_0114990844 /NCGR_PEP_ID=MMETSP0216-20121206/11034_1 /TAXON_ID=223996 /ORGANISM="Protocruzia adherens, Strain Boccale" /LENGTH=77 /DNA_ID=CAMNT_0002354089 /DNA_START=586 /DNA_END=819 /DNA_ORIENTATION=-